MVESHNSNSRFFQRRHLLRLGAASIPALCGTSSLLAESHHGARADHCIVLFLNGGPSHLDMWDMKPEAPTEIRGEFQPISSSLTGVSVSEHLPRLAQQMHRATLIRS
ncbi:MAG: DUF1501 domain-containing protein, partial [Planctomycetaceae bacterium]|nr:DUF1501 domain-containing protein [Planctomycetaceae bacterium]